jgi:hypothetical protein
VRNGGAGIDERGAENRLSLEIGMKAGFGSLYVRMYQAGITPFGHPPFGGKRYMLRGSLL